MYEIISNIVSRHYTCLLPISSRNFYIFSRTCRTEQQIAWGLMQRRFLPENHGMLFHYPHSQKVNFWSFNCYIDLSIAFIDENKIIREIRTLNAFPQKMDPARLIFSYQDFNLYSKFDPIVIFFQERSVTSSVPGKYILEMNLGCLKETKFE